MIDWEDSFDLEALVSQVKRDASPGGERHTLRALSLLRSHGTLEFELCVDPETTRFDEIDTSTSEADRKDWGCGRGTP